MTQYKFTTSEQSTTKWPRVKEAKEKCRKQLEEVFQRRQEIFKRYLKKLQSQAEDT